MTTTTKIGLASVVGALSDFMFHVSTEKEAIEALERWAKDYSTSHIERFTPAAAAFWGNIVSSLSVRETLPERKTISPNSKRPPSTKSLQSLLP